MMMDQIVLKEKETRVGQVCHKPFTGRCQSSVQGKKEKKKKVQWQWMNSPFLGEEKKVRYAYSLFSYLVSVHKAKKVSAEAGRDKHIKGLNFWNGYSSNKDASYY